MTAFIIYVSVHMMKHDRKKYYSPLVSEKQKIIVKEMKSANWTSQHRNA